MPGDDRGRPQAAVVLTIVAAGRRAEPPHPQRISLTFPALSRAALNLIRPAQVICDLMTPDHDALQVAARLADLGWRGRLTVLSSGLPNPRMVEAELRARAPGLVIEVLDKAP